MASAQDLLLAYDRDFTGYTSVNRMARPLESAAALGGTAGADGYYEDLISGLGAFVEKYGGMVPVVSVDFDSDTDGELSPDLSIRDSIVEA